MLMETSRYTVTQRTTMPKSAKLIQRINLQRQ